MPGDMIGDYSKAELAAMTRKQFDAAQAREFAKPNPEPGQPGLTFPVTKPDLQVNLGSSVPAARPVPSANVWASKAEGSDFVCPSGQTCKLRPLAPEKLLEAGLLDKIGILEALADKLVKASEGAPPEKAAEMPTREEFGQLMDVINLLVPLAVAEPTVHPIFVPSEEYPDPNPDWIYVDSIDLEDRMSIMNEALKGIRALSTFRRAG